MSLYDGLDLDEKADPIRSGEDLSGWGSSLKLLETQKQLQAKKYVLQNVKRKPQGTVLAPVVDLKGRKNDAPSELRFNQQTGKLEAVFGTAGAAPFFGADMPLSFTGVTDEYDPLRPNDYESFSKKRREEKRRERDAEDSGRDRRSRHSDDDSRRRRDEDDDDDRDRRRDRDRDHDDDDYERRRRRRDDDDDARDRRVSKATIAPPPSLMDLDIPPPEGFLQKEREREAAAAAAAEAAANATKLDGERPDPGMKFGMGGTVASKIMARMGYRAGQGLGKSEQGMSIALQVEKTSKRGGKIIHERDIAKMQEKEPATGSDTPPPGQAQTKQEISNASLLRNPSKVIVLRNMVGPGEVDDELESETADECGKYGKVIKCLIFEIPDTADDEAVRIFLEFDRLESAIKAVVDLNGRFFGGRIVKGNFYSLDRFHQFELADPVE